MPRSTTTILDSRAAVSALHGYATAVSLHGHTLHSREGMQFIPRVATALPLLRLAIDLAARRRGCEGMHGVDWSRIYWTPPVTAKQALELEENQIRSLGLRPLVSLTDHDEIAGPVHLSTLPQWAGRVPVSVEWTYPFRETFFHIGVHGLPPDFAQRLWSNMSAAAQSGDEARLSEALAGLRACEETLVVLNHPCWDEKGIGQVRHRATLDAFLALHRGHLDALEYNGLRPPHENSATLECAAQLDIPVVSGGDRHGHEPNSCLNLTDAVSFADFARELKQSRRSTMLLLPHQSQRHALRLIHHLWEILRDDPDHGLGWRRWDDRIFYRDKAGEERSLRDHWGDRPPTLARVFVGLVHLMGHEPVRQFVRSALSARQGIAS